MYKMADFEIGLGHIVKKLLYKKFLKVTFYLFVVVLKIIFIR